MVIRGWWHVVFQRRSRIGWCSLNRTCTVTGMGRWIIHIDDVTLPCRHLARGWFLSHGGHLVIGGGRWVVTGSWLPVARRFERLVVGDRRGWGRRGSVCCCVLLRLAKLWYEWSTSKKHFLRQLNQKRISPNRVGFLHRVSGWGTVTINTDKYLLWEVPPGNC